jgi:hypothetical protein
MFVTEKMMNKKGEFYTRDETLNGIEQILAKTNL